MSSGPRRGEPRPGALRRPARRLLPRRPAGPGGARALDDARRRRCCSSCQRAILERDAWPLLRVELPGATAALLPPRPRPPPRRLPRGRLRGGASKAHAQLGIQAPENTRALAGRRPRAPRPRRPRPRKPLREQTLKKRWCSTLWPTQAGAAAGRHEPRRLRGFVERALFLDQPDPERSWGELRAFQAHAHRAPARRARAAHRGRGHRPDAERQGPHVGQLRRQAQHALRRGLHRPARGERERASSLRRARRRRPASTSPASSWSSATASSSSARAPSAARSTCSARWRPTTARGASARSASARTSASTARSARSSSTRRSAAPSTSRSAARIPRPAARTSPRCTGTSSATCAPAAR